MSLKDNIVMPLQPIKEGRFISNKIVEAVLENSTLDMNKIASMDFSQQDREQFAQLIGYSLNGFSELSYVSDETYDAVVLVSENGCNELEARNIILRKQADAMRPYLKKLATLLFRIHPDDFTT